MVGGLGGGKGKGRPGFGPPVNIARPNSLGDFNEVMVIYRIVLWTAFREY